MGHSQASPTVSQSSISSAGARCRVSSRQQQQAQSVANGGAVNVIDKASGGHQASGNVIRGTSPTLIDALAFLDKVKIHFHDEPDVLNRFLDTMKSHRNGAIDITGVIYHVLELFGGLLGLIQGLNFFLPTGYKLECGTGSDQVKIGIITPQGTNVQSFADCGQNGDSGPSSQS